MRYYSYVEPDEFDNTVVITVSEDDIRKNYYPYWYRKMCEKFGKDQVDQNYCVDDCIDDFVVVQRAWEVTK